MSTPPLLVTLVMDAKSFEHFNALRQRHFPPERNHIPAHITLFHHLPGDEEAAIYEVLSQRAQARKRFEMRTTDLWMMGFGVAYRIESSDAQALRRELAATFAAWLTPQDAKPGFKPHITVQNKTSAEEAKTLHAQLAADFEPQEIMAVGMDLWRYLGGPWQHVKRFDFTD